IRLSLHQRREPALLGNKALSVVGTCRKAARSIRLNNRYIVGWDQFSREIAHCHLQSHSASAQPPSTMLPSFRFHSVVQGTDADEAMPMPRAMASAAAVKVVAWRIACSNSVCWRGPERRWPGCDL